MHPFSPPKSLIFLLILVLVPLPFKFRAQPFWFPSNCLNRDRVLLLASLLPLRAHCPTISKGPSLVPWEKQKKTDKELASSLPLPLPQSLPATVLRERANLVPSSPSSKSLPRLDPRISNLTSLKRFPHPQNGHPPSLFQSINYSSRSLMPSKP